VQGRIVGQNLRAESHGRIAWQNCMAELLGRIPGQNPRAESHNRIADVFAKNVANVNAA